MANGKDEKEMNRILKKIKRYFWIVTNYHGYKKLQKHYNNCTYHCTNLDPKGSCQALMYIVGWRYEYHVKKFHPNWVPYSSGRNAGKTMLQIIKEDNDF